MEQHELNRMFDRLAPTAEQEADGLDRLLHEERKGRSMKKLKKMTAVGIAAALMIVTCAAAVVTGMDQRLIDYFGGGEEVEQLLLPGAMPVDVTAEDNGAALHVTQVLRDRHTITAVADFTAPEGTVLDVDNPEHIFDTFGQDDRGVLFLRADGTAANSDIAESYQFSHEWRVLDDGAPEDNHLSLIFRLTIPEGLREDLNITGLHLPAQNMVTINWGKVEKGTLCSGDWSMDIPLPQTDMGYTQLFDQVVGELDGSSIRLKEVYLSPVTMLVTLEREEDIDLTEANEDVFMRWFFALDGEHFAAVNGYEPVVERVILTDRDGNTIPLEITDGAVDMANLQQYCCPFRLTQATGLDQLQGGTLTLRIGDGSVEIPLDNLTPVE